MYPAAVAPPSYQVVFLDEIAAAGALLSEGVHPVVVVRPAVVADEVGSVCDCVGRGGLTTFGVADPLVMRGHRDPSGKNGRALRDERYGSQCPIGDHCNVIVTRPGRLGDLEALTQIYNYYVENTHITFDLSPYTVEQRREWFGHYAETGRHRLLVAVSGEDVLGYATSGRFRDKAAYDPSVETTVYLAPEAVGRGAGTALYDALFAELASEDVHQAFAGVALPNEASLALHRRFGFTEIGTFREVGRKFGKRWDVTWLQRAV